MTGWEICCTRYISPRTGVKRTIAVPGSRYRVLKKRDGGFEEKDQGNGDGSMEVSAANHGAVARSDAIASGAAGKREEPERAAAVPAYNGGSAAIGS